MNIKDEFKSVRKLMLETSPNDLYWRGFLDGLVKAYAISNNIGEEEARRELMN